MLREPVLCFLPVLSGSFSLLLVRYDLLWIRGLQALCEFDCAIISLNCVTNAPSFGPALFRRGFARSTNTSCAPVPRTLIVSAMNSARGMARGSLLLFKRSVCTQGGAISRTSTVLPFSWYRSDSV